MGTYQHYPQSAETQALCAALRSDYDEMALMLDSMVSGEQSDLEAAAHTLIWYVRQLRREGRWETRTMETKEVW